MTQPIEKWLPVPGHEGKYSVSDHGNVWGHHLGRLVSQQTKKSGHKMLTLAKTKHYVHRLVMAAFVGPCPDGMQVCHNDGDPSNNRLGNLRYGTSLSNHQDRRRHGTHPRGVDLGSATRLTEDDVREVRRLHAEGLNYRQIADRLNAPNKGTVRDIIKGRTWRWVDNQELARQSHRFARQG